MITYEKFMLLILRENITVPRRRQEGKCVRTERSVVAYDKEADSTYRSVKQVIPTTLFADNFCCYTVEKPVAIRPAINLFNLNHYLKAVILEVQMK